MLKSLNKNFNIKIQNDHSKLITELFTAAIYAKVRIKPIKLLGKYGYVREIWFTVREMSGNNVLSSLYEP